MVIKALLSILITGGAPFLPYHLAKKPQEIPVRAIYVTAYTAGDRSRFQPLVDLVNRTELNAVVIDLKDYTGRVFIETGDTLQKEVGSYQARIYDLRGMVSDLKRQGIYTIARITVFQDPYLAEKRLDLAVKTKSGTVWRDFKGLAWVDASRQEVWDYNAAIAQAAVEAGFDEVNFDYIRFPSDGIIKDMHFSFEETGKTKNEAMRDFFRYLSSRMRYLPARTSVDLFGMTLWRDDGLGIGQRLEDTIGNFDYVYPMVYPSHFPDNFEGYGNPAEYPYEIVYTSLDKGNKKLSGKMTTKMRPWIQDFDIGADYDEEKIRKQILAANDAKSAGWLLWNASNRYTESALEVVSP